jgi:predicted GH43/DUF377 family glycosyl hydrolase
MKWRKLGLIFAPRGDRPWACSHAHLPTPVLQGEDLIRVYFSALDAGQFGRLGYVDLDAAEPTRIQAVGSEPLLDLGEPGCFDDCGVTPSSMVTIQGRRHLYYNGFQRTFQAPYMIFTGLAGEEPDGRFRRRSRAPVLDRTEEEPFSRSAAFVLREGEAFRAWYWSCVRWSRGPGGVHYNGGIRHAASRDGVAWSVTPGWCLMPEGEDAFAVGRPWVLHDPVGYRMWYSIRGEREPYRLGYAESADGLRWERRDGEVGIVRSAEGWDSEMVCYPALVEAAGRRYLFYNGNRRGATGFGCAVQEGS